MPTMPLNQLAFLSEGRILANDEIHSRTPSRSSIKTVCPFQPGMRPEAEFSGNGKGISTGCLAGALLYIQLCPASTAPCCGNFIGARPENFAKRWRSAFVARRDRL